MDYKMTIAGHERHLPLCRVTDGQAMKYLSILADSMEQLELSVLDEQGNVIAKGNPDTDSMTVQGTMEGDDAE